MSDNAEDQKDPLLKRILLWCLTSPVNVIFIVALIYYGIQAFVLGHNVMLNKLIMVGLAGGWILWFAAKNFLKILFVIVLIAAGAYGCYYFSHQEQHKCEDSGGVWDAKTQTCKEKQTLWQQINQWLEEAFAPEDKKN